MTSLNNVKIGDKLILNNGGHCRVIIVDRVTPTMVVAAGVKYSKKSGREAGRHSTWGFGSISLATDEAIKEIQDEDRRQYMVMMITRECTRNQLRNFTTEALERICKALDERTSIEHIT
jgi:hypothetical protein